MFSKIVPSVALLAISLGIGAAAFAQSPYYVLTNDVNVNNSGTLFTLNPNTGVLTPFKTLKTGEEAVSGGYYAGVTQAVAPGAACIFIADGITNDIAAFSKAAHFQKVGNYSDPSLVGAANMPMLLNSSSTILYAAYEFSSSLAVWSVHPDCSLTLANAYNTTSLLGSLALTHDGKTLLVTYELSKLVGSFAVSGNTLTDNGEVPTAKNASGIAVTNDDKMVIMGTGYSRDPTAGVITADLPGFTDQRLWRLGPGFNAASIAISNDAANGQGCLYLGNTGNGSANTAGVTGVRFTESPLNLVYVNNVITSQPAFVGNVAFISTAGGGEGVYAAETTGYIGVYTSTRDCTVTLDRENKDPRSSFLLSISPFVR